nr:immunoglobulin light chain junction region [Macaca mulatta]MOV96963.1 immunoglobulin light chain junction region [Macaca mulatta]MOV98920.1 immunoglobulin light chain junction region [Macaca mulatta]MOW00570.1 immunoglobulin light chain junction region [Macaca mulatta]MOW00916.1 immunoglobulin light chain junction region [Macaca mulatta]
DYYCQVWDSYTDHFFF